MKKILLVIFCFFINEVAFSQQLQNEELVEYSGYDLINVLGVSEGAIGGVASVALKNGTIKYRGKALEIYDNSSLKGKPSFLLTAETLDDVVGKKEINFQKIISLNKDNKEEHYQLPEYNFIGIDRNGGRIIVVGKTFTKEYIQTVHKGKNYFLKINDELKKNKICFLLRKFIYQERTTKRN